MEDVNMPMDGQGQTCDADGVPPLRLVLQPTGMAVELTKLDQVVGRHMSADLRLPLPDVSRHHCRFVYADCCWQVFDLNSLNGVIVNQQRVEHAVLHHGDSVRLGGFTFQVELTAATVSLPRASERILRSIADALEPTQAKRQAS
jgi:pSer/pThr/pTyr-binding forkhead associated (FHA) protein